MFVATDTHPSINSAVWGSWHLERFAKVFLQQLMRLEQTACSSVHVANMAYMTRLGMWGVGSLYPNFESFQRTLTNRGMGAMEMLAGHLKGSGAFVARTLIAPQRLQCASCSPASASVVCPIG